MVQHYTVLQPLNHLVPSAANRSVFGVDAADAINFLEISKDNNAVTIEHKIANVLGDLASGESALAKDAAGAPAMCA